MTRVLILDDEPDIVMILKELLELQGCQAEGAISAETALELLRTRPAFDAVLADLFMPGMNGRDLIEVMRADPSLAQIPVLLVTGAVPHPGDFPPDGSYQGVIEKPFDLMDVTRRVHEVVRPACSSAV